VWQELRDQLNPKGLEIVAVGLDTLGADGCRKFIEAAAPTHPSLIDRHHVMSRLFGVTNIPSSIWINEDGMIVRPAEVAPAPPPEHPPSRPQLPKGTPSRLASMMQEAAKIRDDSKVYHHALLDWVENGTNSVFALSPEEVVARSRPRDMNIARGHAHFELATQLEIMGEHDAAITHFREAHKLVPDSWTFRRQAWSLEGDVDAPFGRFWQGPSDESAKQWPYTGDWLSDIRSVGAENYNEPWMP
jgi:hypothetical protein